MRYVVTIGQEGRFPDPESLTVDAVSELDAAFQAGVTLALHRPATRLRTQRVKSVVSEDEIARLAAEPKGVQTVVLAQRPELGRTAEEVSHGR